MAKIVGAISISHAPGATGWPDAPPADMRERIEGFHAEVARYLDDARPDVIIAFLDDHFENHFRRLMPTLSIGVAEQHSGPPEHLISAYGIHEIHQIPGEPELADALLKGLVAEEFDVARMGEIEYGNNLMTPLQIIRPAFDIPVVPLFINVFSPPVPSTKRAYAFGEAVRRIVDAYPSDKRVLFLATGGLSHWPPVWTEDSPSGDEFLQRMKRYQTEGRPVIETDPQLYDDLAKYEIEMAAANQFPLNSPHPLVNETWDLEIMRGFERGDVEYFRAMSTQEIHDGGGHGGLEILNWIALMGAMGGQAAQFIGYEPVLEWICGMGYLTYAVPQDEPV